MGLDCSNAKRINQATLSTCVVSIANTMGENETDGKRLKALLDRHKQRTGQGHAAFVRSAKVPGGPSMVSQHISGHRPISIDAAVAYARGLGVSINDISPNVADQIRQAAVLAGEAPAPQEAMSLADALEVLGQALAHQMPDDVREDVADALAKLARRKGTARDQQQVLDLLKASETKQQFAA